MKRRSIVPALAMAVWLAFAGTHLSAITNGQPDGMGHPNVGVMVTEFRTRGVLDVVCSGTLITPTVFLTAAHCDPAVDGIPADQVWVSFDPGYRPGVSPVFQGTFIGDPAFRDHLSDPDIAVVRLHQAPGIAPATLPPAGFLSEQRLRDRRFTAVGYGDTRIDKTRGPNNIVANSTRLVTTQGFSSLQRLWLTLSMNPARGNGGGCFGDSGGPHFLGDVLVSITSLGDSVCRATDKTYRVDTEPARRFLQSVGVPLP